MHSEGFAAADAISGSESSDNEVVQLSETSKTLELLLQYMYRQPQPDLRQVDFETMAGVAEAAEKYQVYAAMTICQFLMNLAVPEHPLEVLKYATKHDHRDIMDYAAPKMIGMSVNTAVASLLPNCAIAWFRYYEAWEKAFHVLSKGADWLTLTHKDSYETDLGELETVIKNCNRKAQISLTVLQQLGTGPEALKTLDTILDIPTNCKQCKSDIAGYRTKIQAGVNSIPPYSSFL